ncbi:MAG TPA: hypothetical protein VII56_18990 [Rhizomicrobium sp.]
MKKDQPDTRAPEAKADEPKVNVWQRPAIKVIPLAASENHVTLGADGSGHS